MVCYIRRCIEQIVSLVLVSVILKYLYSHDIFGHGDTKKSIMLSIAIVAFGVFQYFALREYIMSINSLKVYFYTNIVSFLTVLALLLLLSFVVPFEIFQYICLPFVALNIWGETSLFVSILIIGVIYLLEIYGVGRVYSEIYYGTFTGDNSDNEVDLSKNEDD